MSLKLLKQSVDIVEEDLKQKSSKNAKKHNGKNNKEQNTFYKPAADCHKHKRNIKEVKQEMKLANKKSEENIKRLLALSMNTVKVQDAKKIVQRAHKGRYVEEVIPKVQQESIFTEEDFRKFEEEYFNY